MYEEFAKVYDHMMDNIPYEDWFQRIRSYLADKGIEQGRICDLGCGTGIMTEMFAEAGFDMIGIDKSMDMLALARQKQEEKGADILYLNQSMEQMELDGTVDAFISVCDSMNYLLHEGEMAELFQRVKKYLNPGGYFIFDLKTVFCFRDVIGNQTWVEQDDEVSYIWENYFYEEEDINEYMLTIFRKRPDSELYERVEEAHYQRVYQWERLQKLLQEAGLEAVGCYDENMNGPVRENSERMYVIAKNGGNDEE